MTRRRVKPAPDHLELFPGMPRQLSPEPEIKRPTHPVWTGNKARLIERYLYYFVLVTKHGTYIDAFAGPQEPETPDSWAAKLVLESQPQWLRHFYLFEKEARSVRLLQELAGRHPGRDVQVLEGDCNRRIPELLASGAIEESEATFCLLDQRTFECDWETVRALALHKKEGRKIELFYLLADQWLERAFAGVKKDETLDQVRAWWGRDDWVELRGIGGFERATRFCQRFRSELGYLTAKPWPIFSEEKGGGRIVYFMIHAADHLLSPVLMARAYERAVQPAEALEQLALEFGLEPS